MIQSDYRRIGFEGLKKLKEYGKKGTAEIAFSSFKRVLGETLRSRKFLCQKAEASLNEGSGGLA
jgi:uncharacterized protein YfeS